MLLSIDCVYVCVHDLKKRDLIDFDALLGDIVALLGRIAHHLRILDNFRELLGLRRE